VNDILHSTLSVQGDCTMPKAATLTELEHHIESLQTSDQLKLLEKMVRHLKRTLTGQHPAKALKSNGKLIFTHPAQQLGKQSLSGYFLATRIKLDKIINFAD